MTPGDLGAVAPPTIWSDSSRRSGENWTVRSLQSVAEFRGLRTEWTTLLESSRSNSLFLTWEWLFTWWQHLGTPDRLDILLVRNGDRLTGVAPLTRAGAGPAHWLAPRHRLLGTGTVGSDYLDLIVEDAAEQETVAALTRHFQRHRTTIELGQLPRGTSTAGKVAQRLVGDGWTAVESLTHVCPVVDLADHTWDSFVASLGRSHRQNVRRRLRKLEERFAVELERVESETMLEEAFEILVRLHRQRWDARGGSEALDDPAVVGFHRELTRLALARGWLRLYVLRLDGRAVAALYGFRYGDRFLYYQSGFDQAFADLSVGLAIMALAIRSAIDEGLREYDLLHGAEPYKFHWATSVRELSRLELYPPSFEALLLRTTRRAVRGAKSRLRKWLAATAQPTGRLADRESYR